MGTLLSDGGTPQGPAPNQGLRQCSQQTVPGWGMWGRWGGQCGGLCLPASAHTRRGVPFVTYPEEKDLETSENDPSRPCVLPGTPRTCPTSGFHGTHGNSASGAVRAVPCTRVSAPTDGCVGSGCVNAWATPLPLC